MCLLLLRAVATMAGILAAQLNGIGNAVRPNDVRNLLADNRFGGEQLDLDALRVAAARYFGGQVRYDQTPDRQVAIFGAQDLASQMGLSTVVERTVAFGIQMYGVLNAINVLADWETSHEEGLSTRKFVFSQSAISVTQAGGPGLPPIVIRGKEREVEVPYRNFYGRTDIQFTLMRAARGTGDVRLTENAVNTIMSHLQGLEATLVAEIYLCVRSLLDHPQVSVPIKGYRCILNQPDAPLKFLDSINEWRANGGPLVTGMDPITNIRSARFVVPNVYTRLGPAIVSSESSGAAGESQLRQLGNIMQRRVGEILFSMVSMPHSVTDTHNCHVMAIGALPPHIPEGRVFVQNRDGQPRLQISFIQAIRNLSTANGGNGNITSDQATLKGLYEAITVEVEAGGAQGPGHAAFLRAVGRIIGSQAAADINAAIGTRLARVHGGAENVMAEARKQNLISLLQDGFPAVRAVIATVRSVSAANVYVLVNESKVKLHDTGFYTSTEPDAINQKQTFVITGKICAGPSKVMTSYKYPEGFIAGMTTDNIDSVVYKYENMADGAATVAVGVATAMRDQIAAEFGTSLADRGKYICVLFNHDSDLSEFEGFAGYDVPPQEARIQPGGDPIHATMRNIYAALVQPYGNNIENTTGVNHDGAAVATLSRYISLPEILFGPNGDLKPLHQVKDPQSPLTYVGPGSRFTRASSALMPNNHYFQ